MALLLLAVLGIVRAKSRPGIAQVDIRFAGYRTNSAGERWAKFDIQNNSPFAIEGSPYCLVQIMPTNGLGGGRDFKEPLTNSHPLLMSGEGEVIEVPVPPSSTPWKLGLIYTDPESRGAAMIRFIQFKLGKPYHEQRKTYLFQSEPVLP